MTLKQYTLQCLGGCAPRPPASFLLSNPSTIFLDPPHIIVLTFVLPLSVCVCVCVCVSIIHIGVDVIQQYACAVYLFFTLVNSPLFTLHCRYHKWLHLVEQTA